MSNVPIRELGPLSGAHGVSMLENAQRSPWGQVHTYTYTHAHANTHTHSQAGVNQTIPTLLT